MARIRIKKLVSFLCLFFFMLSIFGQNVAQAEIFMRIPPREGEIIFIDHDHYGIRGYYERKGEITEKERIPDPKFEKIDGNYKFLAVKFMEQSKFGAKTVGGQYYRTRGYACQLLDPDGKPLFEGETMWDTTPASKLESEAMTAIIKANSGLSFDSRYVTSQMLGLKLACG